MSIRSRAGHSSKRSSWPCGGASEFASQVHLLLVNDQRPFASLPLGCPNITVVPNFQRHLKSFLAHHPASTVMPNDQTVNLNLKRNIECSPARCFVTGHRGEPHPRAVVFLFPCATYNAARSCTHIPYSHKKKARSN